MTETTDAPPIYNPMDAERGPTREQIEGWRKANYNEMIRKAAEQGEPTEHGTLAEHRAATATGTVYMAWSSLMDRVEAEGIGDEDASTMAARLLVATMTGQVLDPRTMAVPSVAPPAPQTPALPIDITSAVLVVGAVSAYAKAAKEREQQAKAILASVYLPEGSRMPILNPVTKAKLGTLTVTEPAPKAEVDDEEAFLDHLESHYPEAVGTVYSLAPNADMDRLIALVAEHAPDMLGTPKREAAEWARAEVLRRAENTGDPVPGVSVRTRRGHVSIRPAAGAIDAYRALVASGHVDPLAELPAGPTNGEQQ